MKVNYVPRDGGNNFRVSLFATGANSSFQGDNVTPELVARGLRQPNSLKQTYDVNPTGGGPIVRDKLWFYSATRFQTNQNYVAGIYDNKNAGNVNAWIYEPDLSSQGLFAIVQKSANTRITWQANRAQQGHRLLREAVAHLGRWRAPNRAPESFTRYRFPRNQIALFGWTSPMTNRLLLEARGAYHAEIWENVGGRRAAVEQPTSSSRSRSRAGRSPVSLYRSMYGTYARQEAPAIMQGQASVSYVTGSHAFKAGFDLLQGTHTNPVDGQ